MKMTGREGRQPADFKTILNLAIFKFAADTRKVLFRYSILCGTASDAIDAVKLEIPKGFKF